MADNDFERRRVAAKAELDDLLARGLVQPVFLFPAMFGGTDDPRNVTWLPPACIREKEQFDQQVLREVERGQEVAYTATPAYSGDSMVPSQVHLTADGMGLTLRHVIEVERQKTW
jgi:hypothetical protein